MTRWGNQFTEIPTINKERKSQQHERSIKHSTNTNASPCITARVQATRCIRPASNPKAKAFVVNFAYGRRGSTMNTGTKTQTPVDYETAKHIYDKLVREKMAKGYTEGPDGTPYQNTPKEDRVTGLLPQLLNPIDEQEVKRLLKDPFWALQEKFDGRRVLVRKNGAEIHGINRKGLLIGLPETVFQSAHKITSDFILDGECVGDVLYAFDLLEWDGQDYRSKPYQRRLVKLSNLLNRPDIKYIKLVQTATDPANKERLFRHLQAERKEGVVFKRLDAPYTQADPTAAAISSSTSSTPPVLPWSPRSTTSGASNYACSMVRAGSRWAMSPSRPTSTCRRWVQVVECRYLYAFRESNALYQPVYLGPRKDVEQHECVLSQLKYKGIGEEDLC